MSIKQTIANSNKLLRRFAFREMYIHGATSEAFAFAWEYRDQLDCVRERIHDKEEIHTDYLMQRDPQAPLTSVDAYREGSLIGLKKALDFLSSHSANGHKDDKLAPLVYGNILGAEARSKACGFAWENIDDLGTIKDRTQQVEGSTPDLFLTEVKELSIKTLEGDKVYEEVTLKESLPLSESLELYHRAYLNGLRDVLEMAYELGIEVVSTEAKC